MEDNGAPVAPASKRAYILGLIQWERDRQDDLVRGGKFAWTCASRNHSHAEKYTVLGEEVGEVGHAINERLSGHLTEAEAGDELVKELTQVAAVCVAWIESIVTLREVEAVDKPVEDPFARYQGRET